MSIIISKRKLPKILNIARHICSYFSNKPGFKCDRLRASQCSDLNSTKRRSSTLSLPWEGQFGDEAISGLLIFPDLSQGLVPWSELPSNCRLLSCHLKGLSQMTDGDCINYYKFRFHRVTILKRLPLLALFEPLEVSYRPAKYKHHGESCWVNHHGDGCWEIKSPSIWLRLWTSWPLAWDGQQVNCS